MILGKRFKLEYEKVKNELIHFLDKQNYLYLATSIDNKVTARVMYFVNIEERISLITSKKFQKYKQMVLNPNIALTLQNVQIEAIAH